MKKVSVIILGFSLASCASDTVTPPTGCDVLTPTYTTDVKAIIDQTCSYSGCHDGSGGIGPGDYTTYNGLLADLRNGSIQERVISQADNPVRGMPPDNSVYPESLQDDLSDIQMEVIRCWLQNGFPN